MSYFFEKISEYASGATGDAWTWFSTLSREEWIVVLAVVTVCGFLSFFGLGLRNR